MTSQVTLRPMTDDDGEAVRHLMEDDPPGQGMRMTTRFLVNPVVAWRTLKPDMTGVVAVAPDDGRVVGVASVSFEDVLYNGQVVPSAFLGNLKVHHDFRRQGIAKALAAWRVRTAEERIGPYGVILTGTSKDNVASQNTMKTWGAELHDQQMLRPRPPIHRQPTTAGLRVIAPEPTHDEEIIEKANRFYADYQLYTPLTPRRLAEIRDSGAPVAHYRIVTDGGGAVVAGIMLSLRGLLMVEDVSNVPPPLRVMNVFLRVLPSDGRIRLCEAAYLWYDNPDAARLLWQHIRWEFRDRASAFGYPLDPRSPLIDLFNFKPWHVPIVNLVIATRGPQPMDVSKYICGTLRG